MWTWGVQINWILALIAGGVLNEGDQANVLMPNFDNAKKKSLKVNMFTHTVVVSQFPEDDKYSIRFSQENQNLVCTHVHIQHQTFVKL